MVNSTFDEDDVFVDDPPSQERHGFPPRFTLVTKVRFLVILMTYYPFVIISLEICICHFQHFQVTFVVICQ